MGWLSRFRKGEDEVLLSIGEGNFDKTAAAWASWAGAHGWTYQAQAPELVGRYRPVFTAGAEAYTHLLTTTLHGLPVTAFERRIESTDGSGSSGSTRAFVVVTLPGLPPDDVVKEGPERAMTRLGGSIPTNSDLELDGSNLIASRVGPLDQKRLPSDAELLTVELAALPPTFWRPSS